MTSPAAAFLHLLGALNRLEIPYMVVGSLASCMHGVPRSTNDVDIVAAISLKQIPLLAADLGGEFYADPEGMREAHERGRMFNVIHYTSGFKFDIFPLPGREYDQAAFSRRQMGEFSFDGRELLRFYVASAEDAVLGKLAWYRAGGGVSERQWNDILDVVRVQKAKLDLEYLRHWAGPLYVADLLETALAQGATPA